MAVPRFTKVVIGELENDIPPGAMNTFLAVGDINADGRPDIVLSGRHGRMAWFENPGAGGEWRRHLMADVRNMECGGQIVDLDGDGYADVVLGAEAGADEIWWWHNPGLHGGLWPRRTIAKTGGHQLHDAAIGDITGDCVTSLVFWNQRHGQPGGATLYRVALPQDPTVSPWPGLEVIATGKEEDGQPEEGLSVADIDGDGHDELLAGTWWYKRAGGEWRAHKLVQGGYITTRLAAGDLDGDGRLEVVVSEGDPCVYGRSRGRLAWFKPGEDIREPWQEHLLADDLLDAHTLRLANLCGSGRLDILTGEVGVARLYDERPPRLLIYENDGRGGFDPHVIDEGSGIHEGALADLRGSGRLDIVGRPLHGPERWKLHVWYNEG